MSKTLFENAQRANAFLFKPEELVIIDDDPSHPLYDERAKLPVSERMVKSIIAKGVLKPIVVRKDGARALVVDGRQRVKAAREANRILVERGDEPIQVPAVARKGDDADAMEVMVMANEIREDDNPMVKARKAERLAQIGRSDEQIALAFGCSVATVRNYLALTDLVPAVQKAIEAGRIRVSDAARELAKLPRDEQPAAMEKLAAAAPTQKARKEAGQKAKATITPAGRLRHLTAFVRENPDSVDNSVRTIVAWLNGDCTSKKLVEEYGELAGLVERKRRRAN